MKLLGELPSSSFTVTPDTPGQELDRAFKENSKLVGAVVVDEGKLVGVISRSIFLDFLSRSIGREIFSHRPISKMLKLLDAEILELSPDTPVQDAIDRGLSRANGQAYEPLVTRTNSGDFALVNFHELVLAQSQALETTMEEVREKNRQVHNSIRYAERIQHSMLYNADNMLPDNARHFVIFRPKDIVSGDFYWLADANGFIYIVVADCTGHGVPGAFMSLIGHGHLNTMVLNECMIDPGKILEELNIRVRRSLHQDKERDVAYDGMELGLMVVSLSKREIRFAGAKRPLMYTDPDGNLTIQKGDRHPIGGKQREQRRVFTTHSLALEKDYTYYLFSDGLTDQPNPGNKKFGIKRLRETLTYISSLSFDEKHQFLERTLNLYQGDEPQRDDIAFMGLTFNT